jgi:hypothetical protein
MMSIAERAALTEQLCRDVEQLARAGIRWTHPSFSEIEVSYELTRRRYGDELADAAFTNVLGRR